LGPWEGSKGAKYFADNSTGADDVA